MTDISGRERHWPAAVRSAMASSVRQKFESPVEAARPLEAAHEPRKRVHEGRAVSFGDADRLGLQVVVPQNQRPHFIRHLGEQAIALLTRHLAVTDLPAEQDLDVDLAVGGVDPAGIVDGVRVDAATRERVFDARALGKAEVGAFADNAAAQLGRIDAQSVAGAVACLGVGLLARLNSPLIKSAPSDSLVP